MFQRIRNRLRHRVVQRRQDRIHQFRFIRIGEIIHAFDGHYPHRAGLRAGLVLFGAAPLTFTMRNEADYDYFLQKGVYPIFDSFRPSVTQTEKKYE